MKSEVLFIFSPLSLSLRLLSLCVSNGQGPFMCWTTESNLFDMTEKPLLLPADMSFYVQLLALYISFLITLKQFTNLTNPNPFLLFSTSTISLFIYKWNHFHSLFIVESLHLLCGTSLISLQLVIYVHFNQIV